MNQDIVISLAMDAMEIGLKIALPLLIAGLVIGLIISVFQAITQIQEMTLTFIPKILVTVAVLVIAGPWMLAELLAYTAQLYEGIPSMVGA